MSGVGEETESDERPSSAAPPLSSSEQVLSKAHTVRVALVVLGEIGQSPRMRNHAAELVKHGAQVDIVAYAGAQTPEWLRNHSNIRLYPLAPPGAGNRHHWPRPLFILYALFRVLKGSLQLAWLLLVRLERPDYLLVQNPPAIPALAVAWLASRLRSARFVIDWHNYGWSILALKLGARHPLVRLARRFEVFFGRRADAALCVSKAMQNDLETKWGIAHTKCLYDQPTKQRARTEPDARNALLNRLIERASPTEFSKAAILVSPTSWTADEDFALLLEALKILDREIEACGTSAAAEPLPDFRVFLTGQGPLRPHYEAQIRSHGFTHIGFWTGWLDEEDYATLLGAADLGICLHRSSSGLDLPMKVLDMLGAGLPVCAYDYGPCLRELIEPGRNAVLFSDPQELANHLRGLLLDHSESPGTLSNLRKHIAGEVLPLWPDSWSRTAKPVFLGPSEPDQAPTDPRRHS